VKRIVAIYILLSLCLLTLSPLYAGDNDIIDIGSRLELFVDHHMIDEMNGVRLQMHHPREEGIALRFDKPWEGEFSAYITVLKDSALYRMYYRGFEDTPGAPLKSAVVCYAESRDGIQWVKPELGIRQVSGSYVNNVIWSDEYPVCHNFSPFIDEKPGVPASERYKAIAGTEKSGLIAFVSGDGIHWKKLREEPVITKGMFDSQNVAFWSTHENCYVCYFRSWTGDGYTGFRTISRTTSTDFINWSDPVAMTFGDTPMEHLYTNATQPYFRAPHIYLAMPKRFFPDKAAFPDSIGAALVENPKYRIASSDAVLMSSRGGNSYDRTFMEAFIRPGSTPRDWIARDNTPALGIVEGDPETLYIYRLSHYAQPTSHARLYSLRTDGFVSVHAPYSGGELITKTFRFEGDKLHLNVDSSPAGGIRVEVQDASGLPVPGYSLEDCPEFIGNDISRIVSWRNGASVSALAEQPVRLRFVMRDADLYAFRFH
jgi:hypothetical protein